MHYGIYISNLKTNFKFGIYFIFIGIYLVSICKFFGIYLVSNRYQIDFRYLVGTLTMAGQKGVVVCGGWVMMKETFIVHPWSKH